MYIADLRSDFIDIRCAINANTNPLFSPTMADDPKSDFGLLHPQSVPELAGGFYHVFTRPGEERKHPSKLRIMVAANTDENRNAQSTSKSASINV